LLLAGACSSPQGTEPENSLLGKEKGRKGRTQEGKGQGGDKKRPDDGAPAIVTPPDGGEIEAPGGQASAAPNSGAAKTETEIESTGNAATSASVVVTEPDPDTEKTGIPPDYPDIVSARVEGSAKSFRVTLTFRASLPDKMPDDKTYMVTGFGLTGPKGENGYAFGAQADKDGWKPYGGKNDGDGYSGKLSINGAVMVFDTPWSAVGGPRPFEWYAQSTWFKSLAGTTHYSLDNVPNEGPAKYPAG
jgi:hypothetical protein